MTTFNIPDAAHDPNAKSVSLVQGGELASNSNPIPVSLSTAAATDTVATGTITAAQATVGTPVAGGTVSIALGSGQATVEAQLTGTFSAGTTLIFEGTDDSGITTNWFTTFGQDTTSGNPANISSIAGGSSRLIRIPASGYQQIRMRCNPFQAADSVTVRLIGSVAGTSAATLSTNDGSFAKETGGNLATLVTNTAGIATAANQTTGNTSLASIKTDLDTIVTNTADLLADGDFLTTIATNTANIVTNTADLLADGDFLTTISTNTGNIPAKGAAATAASTPVNIASDQVVPIKRSTVAVYSLASTATTSSSNSGDLVVGPYTEISIDINTTAQTGTNPTIQFFYKRKAADGIYYTLWQSAVLTVAANTISTSIGAGMAYNQSLGVTGQLTWTIGGSNTPGYTFSANIQGK